MGTVRSDQPSVSGNNGWLVNVIKLSSELSSVISFHSAVVTDDC
jgi:hypothetical protein